MADEPKSGSSLSPTLKVVAVCVFAAIGLVGALAFLVLPQVVRNLYATDCGGKDKADVIAITGAVEQYLIENNGRYPPSMHALVAPDENGLSYLGQSNLPLDPWGNPYVYEPPAPGTHEFRVVTYGSDGLPGGEGDARDIDNIMIRNGDI